MKGDTKRVPVESFQAAHRSWVIVPKVVPIYVFVISSAVPAVLIT